ncbi:MAG: hypothetical protein ACT4PV_04645 [Planctomycetaceae bacterium]
MPRSVPVLLLALLGGCHGVFGARTSQEDRDLNNFAEARERAATYYDSKDFVRAAAQYKKALGFRKDHIPTRLGHGYSLMYTDQPSLLLEAEKEFKGIGKQSNRDFELKRLYGLGICYRNLATHYQRRSRRLRDESKLPEAERDQGAARTYAREGIKALDEVSTDDRVSSLKPDAHIGIAHCAIILQEFENAIRNIKIYADLAARARKFWESRQLRLIVVDPLAEGGVLKPPEQLTEEEKRIYERRIARTLEEEIGARKALVETYLWLSRFEDAIAECGVIEQLDPKEDEILFIRGRAYGFLGNYRAALEDLREYRRRQDVTRLTDRLVNLNILIQTYEDRLRAAEKSPS